MTDLKYDLCSNYLNVCILITQVQAGQWDVKLIRIGDKKSLCENTCFWNK